MKRFLLISLVLLIGQSTFAQDKYTDAMKKNIAMLDSMYLKQNALTIADNFTRIADAEKDKWQPYYYAAYATAVAALNEQDVTKKDDIADKATSLLDKAEKNLAKPNSETEVIRAMIATAHLMVDPQSRYMQYGMESNDHLKKAEQLDPTNPRPVLFQAQSVFYTPETFGGGKDAAKPLFDKAAVLFDNFKPADDLSPVWGKSQLDYFEKMYQ